MIPCLKVKKRESDQTFFTENGGALLEELIAFCNGRSNPIRHFSAEELLIATNYYDERHVFIQDYGYRMYKGSLKNCPITVKKYDTADPWCEYVNPYKDIAIGSQMSVHKNVLKVLGCCLETELPTIVYEFAGTKRLSTCISATNIEPLPWKCRLRIAMGLANAVAYLHNAFSRPVIHREIKSSSIILDENNVPKLIDFEQCISIPEGQSCVESDLCERTQFVAPEYQYFKSLNITEKIDVYYFGKLLFELLTGQTNNYLMEHNDTKELCAERLSNVVDSRITDQGIGPQQSLDFANLILRCMSQDEKKRPTMIEVAKELRRIYQSFPSGSIVPK